MFDDRNKAGQLLAGKLSSYKGSSGCVVGLARGGAVVARAVAGALSLPLEVLVVKKLPAPLSSELAIGALAPDGISMIDWRMAQRSSADENYIKGKTEEITELIRQKTQLYRKIKKPQQLVGKTAIIIDDGMATGATMEAAIKWCRAKKAKKVVVAVPVAPADVVARVRPETDELIALETPADFEAVGQWYKNFTQVSDEEVVELLGNNS